MAIVFQWAQLECQSLFTPLWGAFCSFTTKPKNAARWMGMWLGDLNSWKALSFAGFHIYLWYLDFCQISQVFRFLSDFPPWIALDLGSKGGGSRHDKNDLRAPNARTATRRWVRLRTRSLQAPNARRQGVSQVRTGRSKCYMCYLLAASQLVYWLVVWNIFYFPIYLEWSSQLTWIFFRGVVGIPPETTNQYNQYSDGLHIIPWL